jgi:hypothetical protein
MRISSLPPKRLEGICNTIRLAHILSTLNTKFLCHYDNELLNLECMADWPAMVADRVAVVADQAVMAADWAAGVGDRSLVQLN